MTDLVDLRPREREVLALMAQGCSNAGIARQLYLTPAAVEKHVSSVFTKLGLSPSPDENRRVHAVLWYLSLTQPAFRRVSVVTQGNRPSGR
ncbi:response regulator transcription factor [Actinocrispum wychmicini]|uniref:Regulatory LuxR family protein n=1 Tax=Actinocrispum wychmicini TaxID=1213861 RepID=A0A4R2ISD6_9PSEU|nr:regulatory LuxR family protein [Actinocrispum wychmicini]